MCGIVGLHLTDSELHPRLGDLITPMLVAMSTRGPDSAGIALYDGPLTGGRQRFTVRAPDADGWDASPGEIEKRLAVALEAEVSVEVTANHATLTTGATEPAVRAALREAVLAAGSTRPG